MDYEGVSDMQLIELPKIEWIYSMRREKQEILPNIFLGPYQCATKNRLDDLLGSKISHILCVRQTVEARCVKVNFPQHFIYKVIEFDGDPRETIMSRFPEVRTFIRSCLDSGGKILIHGVNGMSLSAALLLAYMMETYNISFEDAHDIMKKRRHCLDVYWFKNLLKEYEPIYQAKAMGSHWSGSKEGASSKRKASDDEMA